MIHALLIHNSFWHSASMDKMEALLADAAKRLNITLDICGNADLLGTVSEDLFLHREKPDFVLFWDKDIRLARLIEKTGTPVFNSSRAISLCDDKTLTHLTLKNIPMPETVIVPSTFPNVGYSSLSFLGKAENLLTFPMIIKEGCGSFGQQVYLVKNHKEALAVLQKHAGQPLLMQKYIEESCGQDKRLYMVNGRCCAAMKRINTHDFRANIAIGGKAEAYCPSNEEIKLAADACRQLGLTFAGVDLLCSKAGPLLCEVNSNAHFTALHQLTGTDIAYCILDAIRGML